MPLEEGRQNVILHHSVHMLGGVFLFDLVRAKDGGVVSAEGVRLSPCEVVVLGCQRRNEAQTASWLGNGGGRCGYG